MVWTDNNPRPYMWKSIAWLRAELAKYAAVPACRDYIVELQAELARKGAPCP